MPVSKVSYFIASQFCRANNKWFVKEKSYEEITGPLSEDFRIWLRNNGFDEEKLTRSDLGVGGSYGGRTNPQEKIVNRPIIFVHGSGGIAIDSSKGGYDRQIEYMINHGYSQAELYATTIGTPDHLHVDNTTHTCALVKHLRMFFTAVRQYTGSQVDIIAHSLGVTMARKAILGGFMREYEGSECDIGEPLQPVRTFIGIAGVNYGTCTCGNNRTRSCNKVTGLWPGTCDNNGACYQQEEIFCAVEDYSQFLKELNDRQKSHRLAEKTVSMYSKNDRMILYKAWGRLTSEIPGSHVVKEYTDLGHDELRTNTIAYQFEQIVAKQEIQGPLSEDFRMWLRNNGFDEEKLTRRDLGVEGSYGGRTYPQEKIVNRPIIFVHGSGGKALESTTWGYNSHIEYMTNHGYSSAELYATTFGNADYLSNSDNITHSCAFVKHLRMFFTAVRQYTGSQVDIIAHSLGVTLARKAILGGNMKEYDGSNCELGEPLQPVYTFIGIAGINYGACICITDHKVYCNKVTGVWPGTCDNNGDCYQSEDSCAGENYSQFLKELNDRQKIYRLAEKTISIYSTNDTTASYKVWGRRTSEIPGSDFVKEYSDLGHDDVRRNTIAYQLEQIVTKQEIQGPLSPDFRDWLRKNGYDESKFIRDDFGRAGSYGGRRMSTDRIIRRPVIFVHGNSGIALRSATPIHTGFSKHIEFLINKGYTTAELYATTYGSGDGALSTEVAHTCEFVRHVREFILAVSQYTGSRVDIIAHSLGVTIARKAILGGDMIEISGNACEIGDALDSIETFIGIAGANYGTCECSKIHNTKCNPVNGFWPGNCSDSNSNDCSRDICVIQERSRLLDDLNRLQESRRLARKIASFYSEDDSVVNYSVWGTTTAIVPNSSISKIYRKLDHNQVKSETISDQYEILIG